MLQSKDLFDVLDLFVLHDLVMLGFPYIQKFTTQREDTEVVTPNNTETSNCKGLGRITFGQDQRTVFGTTSAGIVGIGKLYQTDETRTKQNLRR